MKIFLDDHIVEELLEDFVVEHLGSEKRGEEDGKRQQLKTKPHHQAALVGASLTELGSEDKRE